MSLVSYGSYNFPNPQPFVAVSEEPLYLAGKLDHYINRITLVGTLTGSNLYQLTTGKRHLTTGLAAEYLALTVGDEVFPCVKPLNLSFDESNLTTILPYSIEFEGYEDTDFSEYFGVREPVNTWSYQEQDGRIVKATHTVSAVGTKTGSSNPLLAAKSFVESKVTGFQNLSLFLSGEQGFLVSKTEEVNRQKNSYSITEDYSFSTSADPISASGIVSASSQISYSRENGLQASVNGSIIGELGGSGVNTDNFRPIDAQRIAFEAAKNSKSRFESGIYSHIQRGATSYEYTINELANRIDFSFTFKDPERVSEFRNESSVQVSATKDSNTTSVQVNGNITYESDLDIFVTGDIQTSTRFQKLQEYFSGVNFYGLALEGYIDFGSEFPEYYDGYLNPVAKSETVTKDPFAPSINYSYTFTNEISLSSEFDNLTINVTDSKPILLDSVQESVKDFAIQSGIVNKIGVFSASSTCEESASKLPALKAFLEGLFVSKIDQIMARSHVTGDATINYSFESVYR